ncbi:MAG: hypothetical protein ABIN91_20425 [Mucilaginibacter sp.]|uniref:hypothetical protein n=1 Tax=Mucilaginibacter sp. TaxID=1882438 RepID=UPI003264729F
MQKLYSSITIILIVFAFGNKAKAQAGVGATYIGDYSKMGGHETVNLELERGNWAYRLSNLKNARYTFTLTMKDNSTREVHSKLYADSANNRSYVMDDQKKIYCSQTRRISREDGSKQIIGIATDSCWLFKIVSGKINAYSFLSEGAGSYSVSALQTGTGVIQTFDERALEQMISNDPKAMKAFIKKEYLKAIEKFNADN